MRLRQTRCWWVTALLLLGVAPMGYGQDLAALKQSFAAEIDALNSRDLNATLAPVDERMILFGIFSPFPLEGRDGYRQAVQEYWDDYAQAVLTPINPEFRVIGPTGVAWGNFRLATKQKNGPSQYSDGRYMFTYAQTDGKWVAISMHYSLLAPLIH
jgi:ketosteroid isomerase-like protein